MRTNRNKRLLIKGVLLLIVGLVANEYALWTFDNQARAQAIVLGLEERPYVYRALLPWLAHWLVLLGLQPVQALTVIIVLSAIGLVYGIVYLLSAVRS